MTHGSLSVIVPNHNHARYIGEALEAILSQSFRPKEVIVVDDGSTDDSVAVIEHFVRRDSIIRPFRNERNRGVIFWMNWALEFASGDYVYFAAADDKARPRLFEKSMNLLAQYPQAGLCSTVSGVMNEKGEHKGLVHTPIISRTACFLAPARALAMLRQHGSWFMGNTAIYRRAALIEAGGFIPELDAYCDGFIDLVLALKYGACFIPEPLAMWRKLEGTYAKRMSADLDSILEITAAAKRLMLSKYADLFPSDYVEDWERRRLFEVATNFVAVSGEVEIRGLRRLLRPSAAVDRAFLAGLRVVRRVELLATKLYLFCRLQRHHLHSELARKLRHVVRPGVLPGSSNAGVRRETTKLGAGEQPTVVPPDGSRADG